MNRGNPNGFEVIIERTSRAGKIGKAAPTTSALWVPQISHEILRDLGMSDDAIRQYFCRFRHGQLEHFVQNALHKRLVGCVVDGGGT
jgi:hypothetical protein